MNHSIYLALAGMLAWSQCIPAAAANDALVFPNGPGALTNTFGYANTGVAWSFVPKANLLVLQLGYLKGGRPGWGWENRDTNAEVSIWAGTNHLIMTWTGLDVSQPTDTNGILYTNVSPLLLLAGHQYSIALRFGTQFNSTTVFGLCTQDGTISPRFQPATDLAEFHNYLLFREGFALDPPRPENANYLYLGPTFRFELVPRLAMISGEAGLVVTWPVTLAGYTLETSTTLALPAWETVTNLPGHSGDYYFLTNRWSGPMRFFRLSMDH